MWDERRRGKENPLEKRWIIPHFYYVTLLIFETLLFIKVVSMCAFWGKLEYEKRFLLVGFMLFSINLTFIEIKSPMILCKALSFFCLSINFRDETDDRFRQFNFQTAVLDRLRLSQIFPFLNQHLSSKAFREPKR